MRGIADLVTEMIFPELEAMCLKPAYQRQQQEMGPWDCRSGLPGNPPDLHVNIRPSCLDKITAGRLTMHTGFPWEPALPETAPCVCGAT